MAEEEVSKGIARGLDAVLLNPANVIGRYDWSSWSQFIRQAANRQLLLIPPGSACFCDVGAVVRAHLKATEKGRTGNNYLLGGPQASYAEIVQIVANCSANRLIHGLADVSDCAWPAGRLIGYRWSPVKSQ